MCDFCRHSAPRTNIISLWDNRIWKIRDLLFCNSENTIYLIECKIHSSFQSIGSTKNLKLRWANHKNHIKRNLRTCIVSNHFNNFSHPTDNNLSFVIMTPIEKVYDLNKLLDREYFWQMNLGTIFTGGNVRDDIHSLQSRIKYN